MSSTFPLLLFRPIFIAVVLEVPSLFLFLWVNGNHRLTRFQKCAGTFAEMERSDPGAVRQAAAFSD
jgi:hypothetical protein